MPKASTIVQPRPAYRLAAGVGLCILLASGAGYGWLAGRYARASQSVPIPAGTLGRLPMSIGDWTGRDIPMDKEIIRRTATDDHVNRAYTRPAARQGVNLWVAYGVRYRDLMPHRPEVCYPGNGWALDDVRNLELATGDGTPLRCRILKFTRGTLRNEHVTVLNYYLLDGQYSPDVAALRDQAWRFKSGLRYVAQVQIVGADVPLQGNAEAAVSDFAVASADAIRGLLAEAVSRATSQALATRLPVPPVSPPADAPRQLHATGRWSACGLPPVRALAVLVGCRCPSVPIRAGDIS